MLVLSSDLFLVLTSEVTGAIIKASHGGCVRAEIVTCNTEEWGFPCLIPGLSCQILIFKLSFGFGPCIKLAQQANPTSNLTYLVD